MLGKILNTKAKYFFFLAILIIGGLIGFFITTKTSNQNDSSVLNEVSGQYAQIIKQVENNQAYVFDVRTKAEYDDMHAVDAIYFSLDKLNDGQTPNVDKNAQIYVYCQGGNRASLAYNVLTRNGFTNVTNLGGIDNLLDIGAAVERTPILKINELDLPASMIKNPAIGNSASPTFVQYIDYLCGYCQQYMNNVFPQLKTKYVDTNQIQVEFRNMAFLDTKSTHVASAAMCAYEQDKFWEFTENLMLASAKKEDVTDSLNLFKYADQVDNLNNTDFKSCLFDGKYVSLVRSQTEDAKNQNINSTPVFLFNNQTITGLKTIDELSEIIDKY